MRAVVPAVTLLVSASMTAVAQAPDARALQLQLLKDGQHTGALPGQVVRGPGYGRK